MPRRYHYVITTITTFTKCDLKEKKDLNVMRHSNHCSLCCCVPFFIEKRLFIIFYYTHCVMVMSKRNKILFQCYVHDAMIMKKLFTLNFIKNINCYYVHYAATMTKKYIFSFQHYYIHCTVMMKKNTFSSIANCYYVHYVVIMSKKYFPYSYYVHYVMIMIHVFISALRVLHLDH